MPLLGLLVAGVLAGAFFLARGSGPPTAEDTADVTRADGVVRLDDLRVTLSVSPRPPVAFQPKRFRVRVEADGAPVPLEEPRITFEMTMPMGEHRYTLVAGPEGWQEAEVVLPFCKSGNPRWYAIVEGHIGPRPVTARFRIDLTNRGAASAPGGR